MTVKPELKTNEILDKIQPSFSTGNTPSQFELTKLKKEAKLIVKHDAAEGYALLGLLACLEMDVDACLNYFNKSIRLGSNIARYLNYSSSLLALGLVDEGFELIDSLSDKFKGDTEYLEMAMDFAIQSGRPHRVGALYKMLKRLKPNDKFVHANQFKEIADEFVLRGFTDATSNKILNIAYKIVRENGFRIYSHLIFTNSDEPSEDLYYSIRINATVDKVVDMNIQLSECFAEDETLKFENTFSIAYQS